MQTATDLGRILLLEDEPAHAELVLDAFAESRHQAEVTVVESIAQARAALAEGTWQLIISDWLLPDGDALSLLEQITRSQSAPVVVMTSHGSERIAVEVMRAGAIDYVVKSAEALLDMPHVAARAVREHRQLRELRQTKLALYRSEANLDRIVRAVPDIIYRLDPEGRIVFISHAVTRYGYTTDELVGKHVLELIHPADRDEARYRLAERRTGDRATRMFELHLLPRNDPDRVFEMHTQALDELPLLQLDAEGQYEESGEVSSATFVGTQGIARDITDRRRAEKEIYQLATAVQAVEEGVALLDERGDLVYANAAFGRLTGVTMDNAAEVNLASLIVSRHQRDRVVAARVAGRSFSGRLRVAPVGGPQREVSISLAPLPAFGPDGPRFAVVLHDITEQAQLEEQLREAVKLEAIGTLAGGIAHDFNNVLSAIVGHAELAAADLEPGSDAAESLQLIIDSAQRAAGLTRQILTFARRGEQQRDLVEWSLVAKEVIRLLRATIPPTIKIADDIDRNAGLVLADATQLHQVVMNLATNGYQAMGDAGGTLHVGLRRTHLDERQAADVRRGLEAGEYLCLTVRDNGPGIDEAYLPRIFEPFFTTKAAGHGTGMGLAVVQGIVLSHGGAITVDSTLGEGTEFAIYLPRHEGQAEPDAGEPSAGSARARGQVLIIDDELTLVLLFQRVLERLGLETIGCTSPREALAAVRRTGSQIDLVLCDFMMPEMLGPDVLDLLRTEGLTAPAALVTGFPGAIDLDAAEAMGFDALLAKPVNSATMARLVRDLLGAKPA